MSLLVRTSTDAGALLVRDTDDPLALAVTESTSALALRVRESTSPLAMRVRGLFSPASLPDLAAWYDASDAATVLTTVSPDVPASNGQTVRRWLDKSGAGRHLNQTDLTLQPVFSATEKAVVGDGSNDLMQTASFALSLPFTFYFVGEWVTSTNAGPRIISFTAAQPTQVFRRASNGFLEYRNDTAANPWNPTTEPLNTKSVNAVIYNGATSAAWKNSAGPVSMNIGTNNIDGGLTLFASVDGALPANARMREFVLCAGAHSNDLVARTIRYFAAKHGVTI
jgi:hypothetical protein